MKFKIPKKEPNNELKIPNFFICCMLVLQPVIFILNFKFCRIQLLKEKQAREDAEKQSKELQDRLKKYEEESRRAREGNIALQIITTWLKYMKGC